MNIEVHSLLHVEIGIVAQIVVLDNTPRDVSYSILLVEYNKRSDSNYEDFDFAHDDNAYIFDVEHHNL